MHINLKNLHFLQWFFFLFLEVLSLRFGERGKIYQISIFQKMYYIQKQFILEIDGEKKKDKKIIQLCLDNVFSYSKHLTSDEKKNDR